MSGAIQLHREGKWWMSKSMLFFICTTLMRQVMPGRYIRTQPEFVLSSMLILRPQCVFSLFLVTWMRKINEGAR